MKQFHSVGKQMCTATILKKINKKGTRKRLDKKKSASTEEINENLESGAKSLKPMRIKVKQSRKVLPKNERVMDSLMRMMKNQSLPSLERKKL